MKRLFLFCLVLGPTARVASAEHVVLISVDGLRPDFYLDPEAHDADLPALRSLMREGVYAEGVEGIFPTVTYPSHTTIVTGVVPAKHGVLNNYVLDETGRFDDWYWRSTSIRVKALWDVAPGPTAAVDWPVSVGADIDFNFPEFWIPGSRRNWPDVMAGVASPTTLHLLGPLPERALDEEPLDDFVFRAGETLLARERPTLLLLHVINTDSQQHRYGREHREVSAAFERVDRGIARLRSLLDTLGLSDDTLFVVTGDHGFISTHTEIHLNARFREAGLLDVGPDGAIGSYRALAWPSGGSCAVVLKDPADEATRARVLALVDAMLAGPLGGVLSRISKDELDRLGAFPEALVALEAEEGYVFGKKLSGELLTPAEDLGHHGYLPSREGMRTGFLMVGPRVRPGVRVPQMRQIDIAPTIAHWAGWNLPGADGVVLRGLFEEANP
jgi:predicted AlkP superfamily pyrophosphatase or phosphodiesterase